MGKTRNNSLRMQQAVKSIFEDYRQKQGCLGHVYEEAACGCNNALQMWRGPKGEKGEKGDKGDPGDHAGSFLVGAEFVVDPVGQAPGSYLKLTLRMADETETVIYVNLSELEDVYTAGNGIDITSMVVAARLGAGLTFDNQGNITSAYQFCDGLDETSNVVKVKLDANNNILGFAGSGCKGLTATVNLTQAASGVALVLTGANGTVLNTVPLNGGTGITVQKDAQTGGFTWLVDPSDLVSSATGNNLSISNNKLYVGDSALTYAMGDGVLTLTNASGGTSTVTLPTLVRSLDRADMVCEGENAPYLHLTFKRDNGQNLYQDVDMSCVGGNIDISLDVSGCGCSGNTTTVVPEGEPILCGVDFKFLTEQQYNAVLAGTSASVDTTTRITTDHGEATITTGDLSSYYAICIDAVIQACCSIYCEYGYRGDTYSSPNLVNVPAGVWDSPSYPIPVSSLLTDAGIELELTATYSSEPLFGDIKLLVFAEAGANGALILSFKIREAAIEGCFVVPGRPEPYNASHSMDLKASISVAGVFIVGNAYYNMDLIESGTQFHSFNVTDTSGLDGPIELFFSVEALNDDYWNYYHLTVPSWAAFVAAGEAGLPLEESCDSCTDYNEGPLAAPACQKFFGRKVYVSCEDEGDNVYKLYLFVVPQYSEAEQEELKTDLVLTNAAGVETRVDMKPLLEHIGGKVQEVLDPDKTTVVPIAGQDKAGIVFDDGTGFATQQDMCDWDNAIYPDDIIADDESVTCYYEETLPSYVSLGDFFVDDTGVPVDATIYYYAGVDCDNMTDINSSVAAMLQAPVELLCFDDNAGSYVNCPQKIFVQCEQVEDEHGVGLKFTFLQAATKNVLCLEPSCDPCIDLDFSSITQKTISSIQASFSCPSRVDMTGISFSTVRLIASGHAHTANPLYTFVDSQLSITRMHTGSGYNYDFDRIYIVLTKNGVNYTSEVLPFGVPFYLYDPNDVPTFYMEPCVVSSEVLVYDIYNAAPYHLAITGTNPDRKVLSSIDLDLSCLNGPGGFIAGRRSTSEVTFLPEVTVEDVNRVTVGSAVFIASDCDVPPIIPPSEL